MSGSLPEFGLQFLRLTVWLALLAIIFVPLERLFALHRGVNRMKTVPADLAFYFLNALIPTLALAPPIALLALLTRQVTPEAWLAFVAGLPILVKFAAALVVSELGGYWGHRLCHEVPFLWRFHALHHAPTHIDWLVSSRAHPLDQVFEKLCALIPLYLLGLAQPNAEGATLSASIAIFGTIWGFFVHANVRWRLGPLEWLVSTPAFHHWHHTNDQNRDKNYAALFPFADMLFGSYYLPKHWPPVYGIDAPHPETMAEQILHPLGIGRPPKAAPALESPQRLLEDKSAP